jgi:hypothetical protein
MGGGSAGREARRAREEEEARERRVQEGTQQVRQLFAENFNGDYYGGIRKAYEDYGRKEVQTQFDEARKQLEYALRRSGMYDSSFGFNKLAKADAELEKRKADITETAMGIEQQRRNEVLDSESAVLGQLASTANLGQANAQASQRIANLNQRPSFSPLGSVFQDFTAGLATQADLERQGTNRYNLGVSNWGNNLTRYMRNVGGR